VNHLEAKTEFFKLVKARNDPLKGLGTLHRVADHLQSDLFVLLKD